jgi:hypothetical protein
MTARTQRKRTTVTTAAAILMLVFGVTSRASAGVVQFGDIYQVTYSVNLWSPTPTGNPIENVMIFEWNDDYFHADYSYSIAGSGSTRLVHTVDFLPSSALVLGYIEAVAGVDDEKRHLYMLANTPFANAAGAGLYGGTFSQVFGVGEQFTIDMLIAASLDADRLAALSLLVRGTFSQAAFDPDGDFRVLKWSVPTPPVGGVPEPGTLALMGLGTAGLAWRARRRMP